MSVFLRFSFCLFGFLGYSSILDAYEHPSPSAEDPYEMVIRDHAMFLNELSSRRRLNTFFPNEQSVFYGLPIRYVNSARGNLTFVRRDLVAIGRIPIVVGRVYDSTSRVDVGFGLGWRLSLAETITRGRDDTLIYVDDSASETTLVRREDGYAVRDAGPTEILSVAMSGDEARLLYRDGWSKTFRRNEDHFVLVEVRDAYGNSLSLRYQGPKLSRLESQNGRFIAIQWDANHHIRRIVDDQRRAVAYSYDERGLLRTVTDMAGNEWRYNYDELGRLNGAVDPQNASLIEVESDSNNRATVVRVLGGEYRYRYEPGRTTILDEAGRFSFVVHNQHGIATSITSPTGFVSEVRLDPQNRVASLHHNFAVRARFTYGANGLVESFTRFEKPGQVDRVYSYNELNRPTSISASDGSTVTLAYNAAGDLTRKQHGANWSEYEYTARGDLRVVRSDHGVTTYTHNADGQIETITSSLGSVRLAYFPNGKLKSATFADGSVHSYRYNSLGLRKSVERSNDLDIAYWYDPAGNLIRSVGFDASGRDVGQLFEIDSFYQARVVHHDSGDITKVTYDVAGNPDTISNSEDASAPVLSYTYDASNRLLAIAKGEKIIGSYVYHGTEPDLRDQMDHHTMRVASSSVRHSATIGGIASVVYTRPYGSTLGLTGFDEATHSYELASEIGLVLPNLVRENSLTRQHLSGIEGSDLKTRVNFDRPSNVSFVPPEYATVNCAQGCVFSGILVKANNSLGPITVAFGSTVTLAASNAGTNSCDRLLCRWFDNGVPIGGFLNKTIQHTFDDAGAHDVVASCECSPCDLFDVGEVLVNVKNPSCSVDFSVTPANPKISTAPAMPTIEASVTSRTPSNASISWSASISHTAPAGCTGGPTFTSSTATGTETTFNPTFNGLFGGVLTVKATCSASGHTSKTTTKNINLGGTQPSDTLIGAQIGTVGSPFDNSDLRRIGCLESNLTQFAGTNAFPFYGGGGDTGIMQICHQRTSDHLWNWRSNVERGRSTLMTSRQSAHNHLSHEVSAEGATPFTTQMWREDAIHKYNAGTGATNEYWEWNSVQNAWVKVDRGGVGGYVPLVLAKSATCT